MNELRKMVEQITTDKDIQIALPVMLKTQDEIETMKAFIRAGENVGHDSIILMMLSIKKKRQSTIPL